MQWRDIIHTLGRVFISGMVRWGEEFSKVQNFIKLNLNEETVKKQYVHKYLNLSGEKLGGQIPKH